MDHVEAVQIMDTPEMLTHCKEVMADLARSESKDEELERMQEVVIIHYLACIANNMERVCLALLAHVAKCQSTELCGALRWTRNA